MRELQSTTHFLCDGCGLPITGEPMTHQSILGCTFVAHDFECCLAAHMKKTAELLGVRKPEKKYLS